MRQGDSVVVVTNKHPEPRHGVYVRRDMKRFMPFLIAFDGGGSDWFAACFITVTKSVKREIPGGRFL